jgi:hypothetical protein
MGRFRGAPSGPGAAPRHLNGGVSLETFAKEMQAGPAYFRQVRDEELSAEPETTNRGLSGHRSRT